MNTSLLESIQAAASNAGHIARQATDIYGYCEAVAEDLRQRTDSAADVTLLRDKQSVSEGIVEISSAPYAALQFSVVEAATWVLPAVKLWGDAVAHAWRDNRSTKTGSLLEQLTAIVEELWGTAATADKPLNVVCRRIVDAMPNVDRVGIVMNDDATATGTVVAAFPEDTIGQTIKLEAYGINEQLQKSQAPIVIDDMQSSSDLLGPNSAILSAFAVKSILIIPLIRDRKVVGSIGFDAIKQLHHFTEDEVRLLQSVVRQIVVFMKNQESVATAESATTASDGQQQSLVNDIIEAIPPRSRIDALFRSTAENIGERLGASGVKIYLNPSYQQQKDNQE